MSEKHKKLLIKDSLLSTLFVFVCIGIFAYNPINLKVFNILSKTLKDIEFTDIIFSGKNSKNSDIKTKLSNDIVIINAADRNRYEIARLIDKINTENPKVIGLDFVFEGPKDYAYDSALKYSIKNTSRIVLAAKFKNENNKKTDYIKPSETLGKCISGYANLMIPSMDKTVRYFRSFDYYKEKKVYPFSLEIAKMYDPTKAEKFIKRNKQFEVINYQGNLESLHHFNGNDIINDNFLKGFLKNKIILIGFYASDCNPNQILDDYFYTPMNEKIIGRKFPDTYGVVIQANIINMILNESYINKSFAWFDWFLGFLICFLHNLIFLRLYVHRHLWYHLNAKIIQLLTSIILIFIFIYFFRTFNIKMSASPLIVPVVLTVDLLYFYEAIILWLNTKRKINTYLTTGHKHY